MPPIAVSARRVGPFYEFSIRDNGPGIAAEFHDRIWGIFQTLEARDRVEGAGIGLSLVKKLVEAQSGRVWVVSAAVPHVADPGGAETATEASDWKKRSDRRSSTLTPTKVHPRRSITNLFV